MIHVWVINKYWVPLFRNDGENCVTRNHLNWSIEYSFIYIKIKWQGSMWKFLL